MTYLLCICCSCRLGTAVTCDSCTALQEKRDTARNRFIVYFIIENLTLKPFIHQI